MKATSNFKLWQADANNTACYETYVLTRKHKMGFLRMNLNDDCVILMSCNSVAELEHLCDVEEGHYSVVLDGLEPGESNEIAGNVFTRLW